MTLSDSDRTFSSYVVAIDSITLTANDGGVASLLSNVEPVDLARQAEFPELLSALPAAAGTYVSAQVTLDFSSAQIWYNNNGVAVPCSPQTPANGPLSVITLNVTFDPEHSLVVTQGQSLRVALDIDLAASNSVNASVSPCIVIVQPYLTVHQAPVDSTPMRARGLLVITQPAQNNFIMNTRPLYDLVSIGMGALTVQISPQTYWNINGVAFTGTAGIPVLGQQGLNTAVAAYGTLGSLSGITPTFNATAIYAGSSLESPLDDHLQGVVAGRSGNTLDLHGALYVSRIGAPAFEDSSSATLGPNTIISRDGVAASGLTAASVSVGQQIDIRGQAALDHNGNIILDATSGQARLAPTRVWGTVNSAAAGSLSLNAQFFADYGVAGFSFGGTGSDPTAYRVNTGALNTSALGAGIFTAVDGLVAPFGSAPPDFNASAVTAGTATPQKLVVEWFDGTTKPFSTITTGGFVVNLDNPGIGSIRYIATGPDKLDLRTLPASPLISTVGAPNQDSLTLSIGSASLSTGMSMFTTLAKYAANVDGTLNGTNKAYRLVAVGQYHSTTNTFVASSISLALHE